MSGQRVSGGGVLVVNAGSTSTKLSVIDGADATAWSCDAETGVPAITNALDAARDELARIAAVGHRIVHGGPRFVEPVLVVADVVREIDALADLAPLHNEAGLAALRAARDALPDVPHVACFDTAFHATMPDAARAYGGPRAWFGDGLRRYGFHGLSHEHAASRAAELLGRPVELLRLVTCHLGGGCSLAAVAGGQSVDTTMGFTPLEGLVMATRSGSVDPGLLLHLLRTGTTVDGLDAVLERHSGLLGLSGVSSDLREVLDARDRGDANAKLAVDVFVHRLVSGIGAMVASLRGVDALVFTGGIGEHSPEIRVRAARAFAWLGTGVDEAANRLAESDADISSATAGIRVLVVTAREDLVIARATRRVVAST